jgi:purine-binding chemotaxis protein CheW
MVVFELDGREFALPLREVAEILRMVAITPVPEVPRWVVGVINLRGRVIPVIDLRRRLGFEPREPGLNTPILVVEQEARKLGLIADAVRDVLALPNDALEPPDGADADDDAGNADAVSAIARIGERLVVVLDLDRVTADAAHLAEARNVTDAG